MITAPIPSNEAERLAELHALRVLDTPREDRFDRIVRLAASIFEVPIAYIALIDSERQWFKARQGVCPAETDRETSFCGHTILQDEPLVVRDALEDERFRDNPMVVGPPHVRSYVGHPLKGPGGHNVATLCLADTRPRDFGARDLGVLAGLADMAETELQLVDVIESQRRLIETQAELVRTRQHLERELKEAADYVRSQLPAPVRTGPVRIEWKYEASSEVGGDAFGYHWLDDDRLAIYLLDVSGHGVGAALLSASVHAAVRRQTLPGVAFTEPSEVVHALNRAFPMEQNDNKFFTFFYGVYDKRSRTLRFANAGHPPALLFNGSAQPELLGATTPMVGIEGERLTPAVETPVSAGGRLYVYSDGAYEVPSGENGELLMPSGLARLLGETCAGCDNATRLEEVVARIRALKGGDAFDDDFSLVEVEFD